MQECAFPVLFVDLLEDVFEAPVVFLQDGVLGAQVERPAFGDAHLEGAVCEVLDGTVSVVHPQGHPTGFWRQRQRDVKVL